LFWKLACGWKQAKSTETAYRLCLSLLYARLRGWVHASMDVVFWSLCLSVSLSVCLSVCPVPNPKSRTEGHWKVKIGGRKEAHDTGDP